MLEIKLKSKQVHKTDTEQATYSAQEYYRV